MTLVLTKAWSSIWMMFTSAALLEVCDMERIEVLNELQGHLYGRNTIGGAGSLTFGADDFQ